MKFYCAFDYITLFINNQIFDKNKLIKNLTSNKYKITFFKPKNYFYIKQLMKYIYISFRPEYLKKIK